MHSLDHQRCLPDAADAIDNDYRRSAVRREQAVDLLDFVRAPAERQVPPGQIRVEARGRGRDGRLELAAKRRQKMGSASLDGKALRQILPDAPVADAKVERDHQALDAGRIAAHPPLHGVEAERCLAFFARLTASAISSAISSMFRPLRLATLEIASGSSFPNRGLGDCFAAMLSSIMFSRPFYSRMERDFCRVITKYCSQCARVRPPPRDGGK